MIGALRQLRDPLLLFVRPVTFAMLSVVLGLPRTRGRSASTSAGRSGSLRARSWTGSRSIPSRPATRSSSGTRPSTRRSSSSLVTPLALLPVAAASWLWFCLLAVACVRVHADRRSPGLALPRARRHDACGRPRAVLRQPHVLLLVSRRARVALSRSGGDRGLAVGAAIAAKLFVVAPRRLAAPDAPVPRCGVGVGLGRSSLVLGAWARDRVRGPARLPEAPPRRTGRLRRAQRLASRPWPVHSERRYGSPSRSRPSTGIACIGGCRLARPRGDGDRRAFAVARRSVHPRVADRLAELLRRCCSSRSRSHGRASRLPGSSGTWPGLPGPSRRSPWPRTSAAGRPTCPSRPGSGVTSIDPSGSPRR